MIIPFLNNARYNNLAKILHDNRIIKDFTLVILAYCNQKHSLFVYNQKFFISYVEDVIQVHRL